MEFEAGQKDLAKSWTKRFSQELEKKINSKVREKD